MILGIVLVGLVLAIAGIIVGLSIRQSLIEGAWKKTPNGIKYDGDVDPERLDYAVSLAFKLLATTKLSAVELALARQQLAVQVLAVNTWTDAYGRQVGGQVASVPTTITVGKDLSALMHEIVHVTEWLSYRVTDDNHQRWEELGIWAADNAYRAAWG